MDYISTLFLINGILFFALAAIWKKNDMLNLVIKVIFIAMAFANLAGMALTIKTS